IEKLERAGVSPQALVPTAVIDPNRCTKVPLDGVWECGPEERDGRILDRYASLLVERDAYDGHFRGKLTVRSDKLSVPILYHLSYIDPTSRPGHYKVQVGVPQFNLNYVDGYTLDYSSNNRLILNLPNVGWTVHRGNPINFEYSGARKITCEQ